MASLITLSALANLGLAGKLKCLVTVDRIRKWTGRSGSGRRNARRGKVIKFHSRGTAETA